MVNLSSRFLFKTLRYVIAVLYAASGSLAILTSYDQDKIDREGASIVFVRYIGYFLLTTSVLISINSLFPSKCTKYVAVPFGILSIIVLALSVGILGWSLSSFSISGIVLVPIVIFLGLDLSKYFDAIKGA